MKLNETQQAFKDGYIKARQEDEKWYNVFLHHLSALETEANKEADKIPKVFNDIEDSEDYYYYQGVFETLAKIKKFLGGKKQ